MEKLINAERVAEMLDCSIQLAYLLMREGIITSYRIGKKKGGIRTKEQHVQDYLSQNLVENKTEIS